MKSKFDGILNIHKPAGVTSTQVVGRIKGLLPRGVKIGHAGTLDEFATGVLLVLVGRSTKRSLELMSQPKQYQATIKFGATTLTYDPDSPETPFPDARPVTVERIRQVLPRFIGAIEQTPPLFSALKIGGKRVSDRVRAGQSIELCPRTVRIDHIEILRFESPCLELRIECGKGTYIRALARDLGQAVEAGAYVTALARTAIGTYRIEDSIDPASLIATELFKQMVVSNEAVELPQEPGLARSITHCE